MNRRTRRAAARLEAAFEAASAELASKVTQAVADRAVVLVAAASDPVSFNPEDAYRPEWWVELVDQLLNPALHDAALAALQEAAAQMGVAFDLVSPMLEPAVAEQLASIAGWTESQRSFITSELQQGMRKGWSVDKLIERLVDNETSPLNRKQARAVAQTEMIGAQNSAAMTTYLASGLAGTVRWMSTPDARTRPSHVAANGQERRLGEPFQVGGHTARWPADPNLPAEERLHCRCRITFHPDEEQPPVDQATVQTDDTEQFAQRLVVRFYSGSQPRDSDGRWTKGGAGPKAPKAPKAPKGAPHANPGSTNPGGVEKDYAKHLGKVQRVYNDLDEYERMRDRYDTTKTMKDRNGNWTPERQALHKRILDEFDAKHRNVPSNGEVIITGGLGGAGKTTILKKEADRLGIQFEGDDATSHATVNPDDFKEIMFRHGGIPDVPGFTPAEASTFVHAEAKELSDRATERLMARNANVIYDFTMSSEKSTASRVGPFLDQGYKVSAVFVDVSVDHARDAAEARHKRGFEKFQEGTDRFGGRFVPGYAYEEATPPKGSAYRSTNRYVFEQWRKKHPEVRTLVVDNDRYQTRIVDDRLAGRRQQLLTGGRVQPSPDRLVGARVDQAGVVCPVDLLAGSGLRPRIRIVSEAAARVSVFDTLPRVGGGKVDQAGGVPVGLGDQAGDGRGSFAHPTIITARWNALAAEAGATVYDGAMVALAVPPSFALDVPGALRPGELHITLRYLGHAAQYTPTHRQQLAELVDHAAGMHGPMRVRISGWGRLGDEGATVVYVEGAELAALHASIAQAIPAAPDAHPIWTPHFTLAYGPVEGLDAARLDSLIGSQFPVDQVMVWFGSVVSPDGIVTPGPGSCARQLAGRGEVIDGGHQAARFPQRSTGVTVAFYDAHQPRDGNGRWTSKDYGAADPSLGPPPWKTTAQGVSASQQAKKCAEQIAKQGHAFNGFTISSWADKHIGGGDARINFEYYVNANAQRLTDVHFATKRMGSKSPAELAEIEKNAFAVYDQVAKNGGKLTPKDLYKAAAELGFDEESIIDIRSWNVQRASSTGKYLKAAVEKHKAAAGVSKEHEGPMTIDAPKKQLPASMPEFGGGNAQEQAATYLKALGENPDDYDLSSLPKPKKFPGYVAADGYSQEEVADLIKKQGKNPDDYDLSGLPTNAQKADTGKPPPPPSAEDFAKATGEVPDKVPLDQAQATWSKMNTSQKKMAMEFAEATVKQMKVDGEAITVEAIKAKFAAKSYDTSLVSQGVYALVSHKPSLFGLAGDDAADLQLPKVTKAKAATATGSKKVGSGGEENLGFTGAEVASKNALGLPVLKGTKDATKVTHQEITGTTAQNEALYAYHDGAYSKMNSNLRNGGQPTKKDAALTEMLQNHQLEEDVTVYRGIAIPGSQLKPGQVFTDHGFISTDISGSTAKGFSGGQTFMVIHAPKGTKGVYKHNQHSEKEFLMQRGTTFQVVGKVIGDGGKEAWHVKVIAQPLFTSTGFQDPTPRWGETNVLEKLDHYRVRYLTVV